MQKIIKVGSKACIFLDSGEIIEQQLTEEQFKELVTLKSDEEIKALLDPNYKEILNTERTIKSSQILTVKNGCIYWKNVSPLSLPADLVSSIIEAEKAKNKLLLETYKNFWTLMSLNTNRQCRENLYKFLNNFGIKLAKCGFFVAYRNVEATGKKEVYTDHYSHSTVIKMGEMVILDRKKCNCDSNVECAPGLHVASAQWLSKNYFGNIGVACLVNPADVVAVPIGCSEFGKLRTCAYLPIDKIDFNESGNVIPLNVENGFDCSYVSKVIYEGLMGTEEDSPYRIIIPKDFKKESIQDSLLEIAMKCITERK